jgi:hypothetical protein
MSALCSAATVAAVLAALLLVACVVVYTGEQRMLQPQCLIACDATAAKVEGSASGSISQTDESQGHASKRDGGK